MNFERLILTQKNEFFRFSINYNDLAYLLFTDTFSKASKEFGKKFYDDDFEPNQNQILIEIGVRKELTGDERKFLLNFVDSLLSFKPSIDYLVDFFFVEEDIEFNYPFGDGFVELIEKINRIFKSSIEINDILSFNNIMQK